MIDLKSIIKDNSNLVNTPDELRKVLISKYPNDKEDINIIIFIVNTTAFTKIKEKEIIDLDEFDSLVNELTSSDDRLIDKLDAQRNSYLLINALNIKITSKIYPPFEKVEYESEEQASKNQSKSVHKHYYESLIVPSTCIEKGYTLHRCNVCGDEFKDSYKELSDHKYVIVDEVIPSCGGKGQRIKRCLFCNNEITEPISKGHTFSEWVDEKRPTCTEKGTRVRKCKNCDYEEREYINPLGHKYSTWKKDGKYKVCFCENCGEEKRVSLLKSRLTWIIPILLLIVFASIIIPIAVSAGGPKSGEAAKEKMERAGYIVTWTENGENGEVGTLIAIKANFDSGSLFYSSITATLYDSKDYAKAALNDSKFADQTNVSLFGKWVLVGDETAVTEFKK